MPNSNEILKKYWYLLAVLGIFIIGLWIRLIPMVRLEQCLPGMVCLQALDPFYIYRMAEHVVTHNFHLMSLDALRYYPMGVDPHLEFTLPYYSPAILYALVSNIGVNMTFLEFAKIYPALCGAFASILLFFIGKELFDIKTGLFAAFFFAVSPSVIYRTAAGFIEKEPIAVVFMFSALYFFIRALKRNSLISGTIAGLSLAGMSASWGGVQFVFGLLAAFAIVLLVLNKQPKSMLTAYAPTVLIGIFLPYLSSIPAVYFKSFTSMLILGTLGIVAVRDLVERYALVKKENLRYVVPVLLVCGGLFVFIGGLFSQTLAGYMVTAQTVVSPAQKGVIGSTVAENNPASWGDFKANLGANYAATIIPSLGPVLNHFSLWWFVILAGVVVLIKLSEENKKYKQYIYFSIPVLLILLNFETELCLYAFLILVSLLSKRWELLFVTIWLVEGVHGTLGKVRMMFLFGPAAALFGAYFISNAITYIFNLDIFKKKAKEETNILPTIIYVLVGLVLVVNLAAGYSFSKNHVGPSLSPNWQQAMDFLKTNTTEDSIIFSWWDYGYWFQTAGERTTIIDGGNLNATADVLAARFFTRRNETEWGTYLRQHDVDYILVDYTLIGKYSAMSKIANHGEKINSFIPLPQPQQVPRENGTLLTYSLGGGNAFWVMINPDGTITQPPLLVTNQMTAYVKYVCNENGIMDMNPLEDDKPIWEESCIMFSPFGVYYPTEKEIAVSAFAELYLWDGKNIDFVEKVFDNTEIKIFKTDFSKLK